MLHLEGTCSVCISSSFLSSKSNGVETLNNVLLIMHQIVQVLAVATSCLEQINQSMPLLLVLQVLQAWLELQSCHLNSCFTYFILSSNWLLPTFPFPLLFLFLPLIWGNYFIFQGWRFLVFILFSTDFSVKAIIALFTLSLCPFATSNCLSRCLYVPCLFDLHLLVVQFRMWSPVLQSFEAVCRKPAWDLLQMSVCFLWAKWYQQLS